MAKKIANNCSSYFADGYTWVDMGNRPLKFPVHGDGPQRKIVMIPEGAKHVQIAFKQSYMKWYNADKQRHERMNVYKWNGKTYHGHS